MRQIFNRLLLLIGLIAALEPCCMGQGAGQVKTSFRLMSWDKVITGLMYAREGKATAVTLLPNARSPFYKYSGPDPVPFFKVKLGPDGQPLVDKNGQIEYELVGSVSLQGFKRPLVMFCPKANAPAEYSIMAIEDDDASLPGGSCRFLNFSNTPLQVNCGASSTNVLPSQSATVSAAPAPGESVSVVLITANSGQNTTRVYANRWLYSRTLRILAFIFSPPGNQMYVVKRITEDTVAAQEPTPARH